MINLEKKGINLQPGESKEFYFKIHKDKEIGKIVLNYSDKYGNEFETSALINIRETKIIKQDFRITKKVKDCPEEDMPHLVIDEEDFRRQTLADLYNQLTPAQQNLFNRMYVSIDEIPDNKINWAIQQCAKTIDKNKNK